ncbi:hypothetical protein QX776_09270 [Alteromonadaceae bacterium BrNp21-10]|nr:hypothetical protein [Alteromonadaceae bacterium BrNp21-10]
MWNDVSDAIRRISSIRLVCFQQRYWRFQFSVLLSVLLLCAAPSHALSNSKAGLVVVVGKQNPIDTLSKKQVIDIFMGRFTSFPNGEPVYPVDYSSEAGIKAEFYLKLVNQSERKINAYWSRLLFSGRAKPPLQAESETVLLQQFADNANTIGYLPLADVTEEMKIVFEF